jgi:eukaryotic-like serine/threonine-protein kinase
MTPDRFEQIEELYHSAREASSSERAALLAQADPELRGEVESLLARQNDRMVLDHAIQWPGESRMFVFSPGVRLGPYEVESKIGEGGMGNVFRGIDTRLHRPVAIKFAHQRFTAHFEREARAISSLNHPHICTLYDIGPNYLVMELLQGETLAARLKSGPLPTELALHYASQIAAALADAHEHGIVHRDLKPGNIMLVKSGVKVLDFGLAIREGDATITDSRMVIGTPAYMAPEQREGKPADVRTDIYSFGCIFYEMLTGSRVTPDRKPLPSKTFEKAVSRCLEADPARRWQSVLDLMNAIGDSGAGKNRIWMVVAAMLVAALLVAMGTGGAFLFRRTPKLTDKDVVVLADFVNNTGDPIFDGTLRQGLAIDLEQSPFLKIMDDDQVHRALRLMSVAQDARVTNPVAHEICLREGAAATIDGAIAIVGKSYVLTLHAVACQEGATLAREQVQAKDKDHVLNVMGAAAAAMRATLGESLKSIEKLNRPLEQATTPSLEALQNYTTGHSEMSRGHSLAAVPLFQRAVALDPNFAMAYEFLGVAFDVAGDMARSREYVQKAFDLIDRVSDHERDIIAPVYYATFGQLDKAIDAQQLAARTYPRSWISHNALSGIYIDTGRYEEGLKEGLEAARLQPDAEPTYRRQLDAYICLNRLAEAKRLAGKLRAQGLDQSRIHQRFLEIAYIEEDQAAADVEIQWFAGKPEEYLSPGLQAAYRNVHGRRRESHQLYRRAAETALRRRLRSAASEFDEADAQADALSGNCLTVRRLGRPALALAICGDAARAERLAADTSRLFPNGTIWNAVQLPAIRAAIAINRDQPMRSVELLASASPYDSAYFEAVYLRGLAYLKLNDGAKAAAEFQKIASQKGANWARSWRYPYWGQFYSLSYLGIARGSALAGDTARAAKAFQNFFELWKDADPGIPILQEAKSEYAKLR